MRVVGGREAAQKGGAVRVVIDEEPGLFGAHLRELVHGYQRRVFRLVGKAGDEARAERREVVQQRVLQLSADPPDAAIALAVAPGIFLGEHGFADAAQPAHGERGLAGVADGDGAFRGELRRERVEHLVAAREAFHRADVRVADLLARTREGLGYASGRALVDPERFAHGFPHRLAQRSAIVQNRHEIGIGERREVSRGRAIGDAEDDHALVEVGGVVRQKGVVFLPAVLALLGMCPRAAR